MKRYCYTFALLLTSILGSGCATFPTGPAVPIDSTVTEQAMRDVLLSYVIAAHPELTDEQAQAEVDRIMADESSELMQEIRRIQAIKGGIYVLYELFDFYFGRGPAGAV